VVTSNTPNRVIKNIPPQTSVPNVDKPKLAKLDLALGVLAAAEPNPNLRFSPILPGSTAGCGWSDSEQDAFGLWKKTKLL
jgi:hypothetical protein